MTRSGAFRHQATPTGATRRQETPVAGAGGTNGNVRLSTLVRRTPQSGNQWENEHRRNKIGFKMGQNVHGWTSADCG